MTYSPQSRQPLTSREPWKSRVENGPKAMSALSPVYREVPTLVGLAGRSLRCLNHHSITSSARSGSPGGMFNPSAFAVFMLITS